MTTPSRSRVFTALFLALLLDRSTARAQQALSVNGPQILDSRDGKIRVVPVAAGLFHPWSLAFADAHTLVVTERNGRLRIIRDGVLLPEPAWTSPSASGEGADALHFVA